MSVSISVICDHPVITKYFYWGEYQGLKISAKPSTQQQLKNSHNLTSSYKEVRKL